MKRSIQFGPPLALVGACFALGLSICEAQLRPVPIRKAKADRALSNLSQEEGAIYLEGLVNKELKVQVTQIAPIYTSLQADRWLGNLFANQNVTLLAISENAYRVRGQAKQGQVAGWVGKAMIDGVSAEFEENLSKLYERQVLVNDLIDQRQVAMGMTQEEVVASLGVPSKRNSKVDKNGQSGSFEYITYDRVPQTQTAYDQFGRPFQAVTYLEVETGKVTISFEKSVVSAIEESEGVNLQNAAVRIVPPPIILF